MGVSITWGWGDAFPDRLLPPPPEFLISRSSANNLHFEQVPRGCCWSWNHTLRTTALDHVPGTLPRPSGFKSPSGCLDATVLLPPSWVGGEACCYGRSQPNRKTFALCLCAAPALPWRALGWSVALARRPGGWVLSWKETGYTPQPAVPPPPVCPRRGTTTSLLLPFPIF